MARSSSPLLCRLDCVVSQGSVEKTVLVRSRFCKEIQSQFTKNEITCHKPAGGTDSRLVICVQHIHRQCNHSCWLRISKMLRVDFRACFSCLRLRGCGWFFFFRSLDVECSVKISASDSVGVLRYQEMSLTL